MNRFLRCMAGLLVIAAPRLLAAQERGAVALGEAVAGLDVTVRVLMIGAHPDDEDTQLIAWLARGRQVETGYLSLTRGDGGQNLIGNELGERLGMIRTEELLAARRVDGGRQYFSRAFDFGFSKTAEETFKHWPRDSILRDVVTVVRAFKPHIIIAVFSGTPRDGHGHHQVSAILAREAYDAAMDTVRFPRAATLGAAPWTVSKFYRASRFAPAEATVTMNVGELSAFRGRTYAEIASISRSQHLSQGFGQLERRGTSLDYLKLEASRVSDVNHKEASAFDDLMPGWSRFAAVTFDSNSALARRSLDSLPLSIAAVRATEKLASPSGMVSPLATLVRQLYGVASGIHCGADVLSCGGLRGDLAASLETAISRASTALLAAAGVQVEATAPREALAAGESMQATLTVYNQGTSPVMLAATRITSSSERDSVSTAAQLTILPDSATSVVSTLKGRIPSAPWWLVNPRRGDVFTLPRSDDPASRNLGIGEDRVQATSSRALLRIANVDVYADAGSIVNRFADPARGELRRPVAIVPAISVLFDNEVEYARAGVPFDRSYNVRLHSSSAAARSVTVILDAPGLTIDSATRRVAMEPFADAVVSFRVKGTFTAGRHRISANATTGSETFAGGFLPLQYAHIRPLRYYRSASVDIEAVTAALPAKATVAYIQGVGDNVAPMLSQLGLNVVMLSADELATRDLKSFGSIVVGPRAFAASPSLVRQAARLQDYARAGGTVIMQYGQQEIQAPGILPYPVTLQRTAERVTVEEAPVKVIAPQARILSSPNRIAESDFANWVQERSTYMPTTADPHWQRILEMHDPGEPANENALLVAPVGKGAYVYATLALFRQLPAGVPGAGRIFLNLLDARPEQVVQKITP